MKYFEEYIILHQVMLLTDGDVTNSTEVIDLVKKNASNTRYATSELK